MLRYDWSLPEITALYELPFPDLLYRAQGVHRAHFPSAKVQRSTLLSIKTGGCSEDCKYCPQSSRYDTGVERHKLLPLEMVRERALEAKSHGSTRFCMGAAWRQVKDSADFDGVLELVREVTGLGLEVCCTLGMLSVDQARRLKEAGCHAYNHNLDTSPEFYNEVITTRTYQDRLNTLKNVRTAGMTVCCGGILGMGESISDRLELLRQLAVQRPHPESVPINMLVRVEGTPMEEQKPLDGLEYVRTIATARIIMPTSYVRMAAGRTQMSEELQALCFCAGANSIFSGERLLTTPNPGDDYDGQLLRKLGMEFFTEEDAKEVRNAAGEQVLMVA